MPKTDCDYGSVLELKKRFLAESARDVLCTKCFYHRHDCDGWRSVTGAKGKALLSWCPMRDKLAAAVAAH